MSQSQAHSPTQEETTEADAVNIPTLVGVARKVAQQDKVKLDEKQHIAYEIIACTFLLELVEEGRDKSSILGQYLGSALGSIKEDMDLLVEQLIARGGMSQLLMFLTGPAGAGKSTAVKWLRDSALNFVQQYQSCGMTRHSTLLLVQDQLRLCFVESQSIVEHL